MALCKLCSTIPFDNLPPFPKIFGLNWVAADNYDMPDLWSDDSPGDPLGFPYHESFGVLADSTFTCPLCTLVQTGILRWIELYNEVLRTNRYFAEFGADEQPIPEKQKLWLTRRKSNAEGFAVFAWNPTRRSLYALTGVSFSVEVGSPLSSKFPLRPVETDSGSLQSLDKVKSWLENCVKNEPITSREQTVSGEPSLPSRVLDVNSDSSDIRLVSGVGRSGCYACLSYCWGSSRALMLTRDSISAHESSIALSDLPRTIFDAVLIARHLGLRYLWVDSLCICQDDSNDWAQESALMGDIYSKAHIVIAASHANDKSVGCFHRRARPSSKFNYLGLGDVEAQLLFPDDEFGMHKFESEPLSQRGWALQERILARRIVHYNDRQMYFECDHGVAGEDGCAEESRYCDLRGFGEGSSWGDIQLWNMILMAYGPCKLSKETDKLPALTGLARVFKERFQTQYVAGLWSHELIRGLAWEGQRGSRSPSRYIGPSWSWANFDGTVTHDGTTTGEDWASIAKVIDWYVQPRESANPYGEVETAWLHLEAPITRLTPSKTGRNDEEIRLESCGFVPYPRCCTELATYDEGLQVQLDYEEDLVSGVWRDWDMHVVLLRGDLSQDEEHSIQQEPRDYSEITLDHMKHYGLVVSKIECGHESRYQRVGWMYVLDEEATRLRLDTRSWAIIKLV